ncbi:transcriptional regulator, TetR family [Glycomyces sambucus]|uniref:Transcriptional regulator, TetR family n=1 Tax=Glycomyces sambucus TaxID=380244 RepID=A0A1G9EYT4_9ACTN|nr:TetR family transcriptional regulator [Glycomyces sambucus]SDK81329.1 transcriptional regulator, TetR family [Glycomyces sambucus]
MGGTRREVPNDPGRKARILDAVLDVVAESGIHRTTHRRVAARAGVPLGSLTYYFAGLDDLLFQAFARLADTMSEHYRDSLARARTRAEAEAAVVELVCGPEYGTSREMTLIFELYGYANHHPQVMAIARDWLHRSRESLHLHFPERVCMALDVLIEGWPIQRVIEGAPLDRGLVAATVRAIVAGLDPEP